MRQLRLRLGRVVRFVMVLATLSGSLANATREVVPSVDPEARISAGSTQVGTAARSAGTSEGAPTGPVARSLGSPPRRPGAEELAVAFPDLGRGQGEVAAAVRIVVGLTLLAILPSLLVCASSFLRIIIVLSMLRHAIGMPETPPNTVLIGLALFLTAFTMQPVLRDANDHGVQPFLAGHLGIQEGIDETVRPLRGFMVRQTREQDMALVVELARKPTPASVDDIGTLEIVPAFMLSELRAAFQIGFVIFLPFLLIDLMVSSILMALGMMMMPPIAIALPVKILLFVLVDGWSLIVKALVGSFQ